MGSAAYRLLDRPARGGGGIGATIAFRGQTGGAIGRGRHFMIRICTAGWNIPKTCAATFTSEGRHLERYARVMDGAEIDSSFHRSHRLGTYARWAGETPEHFRFAVKLPRAVTHAAKLVDTSASLASFFEEVAGLGPKLGVVLVQLPPSLAFDAVVAERFFASLRERFRGSVACEPRHGSWFATEADDLLAASRVARVAADPTSFPHASEPGGWSTARAGDHGDGLVYYRWHGSPRTYWSAYDDAWLEERATTVARRSATEECWCVFDNTAAGAALADALRFRNMVVAARGRM